MVKSVEELAGRHTFVDMLWEKRFGGQWLASPAGHDHTASKLGIKDGAEQVNNHAYTVVIPGVKELEAHTTLCEPQPQREELVEEPV